MTEQSSYDQPAFDQQAYEQQVAQHYQQYYEQHAQAQIAAHTAAIPIVTEAAESSPKGKLRAILAISTALVAALLLGFAPATGLGSIKVDQIFAGSALSGLVFWVVIAFLAGLAAIVALQLAVLSFRRGRPLWWGVGAVVVAIIAPMLALVLGINGAGDKVSTLADDAVDYGYKQAASALEELASDGEDVGLLREPYEAFLEGLQDEGIDTERIEEFVNDLLDDGYIEFVE